MNLLVSIAILFTGVAQEKPLDGGEIPWTRFGRKDTEKFHQFLEDAKSKEKPVLVFFT